MNRSSSDLRASTSQFNFMQRRVKDVETHLGELCQTFSAFCQKNAKVRDRGDDVAKAILNYADSETLNRTTRSALTNFVRNMSAVQDYKDTEVQRLEAKVVQEFSNYGPTCKQVKDDLKASYQAKQKELIQKKRFDRIKDKSPMNRQQISQAEIDLQRAISEASRYSNALINQMDSFEQKKLHDVKRILSNFVKIELKYHAKALEFYTKAYADIESINEEEDLEEFRNCLRITHGSTRMNTFDSNNSKDLSLNSGILNTSDS